MLHEPPITYAIHNDLAARAFLALRVPGLAGDLARLDARLAARALGRDAELLVTAVRRLSARGWLHELRLLASWILVRGVVVIWRDRWALSPAALQTLRAVAALADDRSAGRAACAQILASPPPCLADAPEGLQ